MPTSRRSAAIRCRRSAASSRSIRRSTRRRPIEIVKIFTEVIVAPSASDEAQKIIATKKNLRLLVTGALADPTAAGVTFKSLAGGMLVQSRDNGRLDDVELKVVTKKAPTRPRWPTSSSPGKSPSTSSPTPSSM